MQALRQELATAQSVQALEERIDEARRYLATAPVVGLTADPQVAGLAALLGTEEPTCGVLWRSCSRFWSRRVLYSALHSPVPPRQTHHPHHQTRATHARQRFPVAHPAALRLPGW